MFIQLFLLSCLFFALSIAIWMYSTQPTYRKIQNQLQQSLGKKIYYRERVPLEWGCYEAKEGILLESFTNEDYIAFDEDLNKYEIKASMIMKITKVCDISDEELCLLLTSSSPLEREFARRIKAKLKLEPQWMKDHSLLEFVGEGFKIAWE